MFFDHDRQVGSAGSTTHPGHSVMATPTPARRWGPSRRTAGRESDGPRLSVVVVAFNISRELPRTLRSLAADYQQDIDEGDYEVIVVDNGSSPQINESVFEGLKGTFTLLRLDNAPASPVFAVNAGLRAARGDIVGAMLDGARIASPGLLHFVLGASALNPRMGVVTLGWYLGYDYQRYALQAGWTQTDEDRLLESIEWPRDGYRLFEIATMDESSVSGWFQPIVESNALFLPSATWSELKGYDEHFTSPGGGLANHDVLRRASEIDGLRWTVLLGEATFHQLHGGIATNVSPEQISTSMPRWIEEFETVRRRELRVEALPNPVFLGTLPRCLRPRFAYALNAYLHHEGLFEAPVSPPISMRDPAADPWTRSTPWTGFAQAAAQEGLDVEAMMFSRKARAIGRGQCGAVGPLLACIASTRELEDLPPARRAQFYVQAGEAHELMSEPDEAKRHYEEALSIEPGNTGAYLGLSRLRMPGSDYYALLEAMHALLRPSSYLEIGVAQGVSLSLAKPPTVAVGVDPAPAITHPLVAECRVFPETSRDFFAMRDVRGLFGGHGPSVVFIDGLHQFPAVLEDFINVEAISDPRTVVILHDMIPFDEPTQRPERTYNFYTGDVWKLLHCLAAVRQDLSWFTVRTPPSGLTFVTGLDAGSTILRDQYDLLITKFGDLSFEESQQTPGLVVENESHLVLELLEPFLGPRRTAEDLGGFEGEPADGTVQTPTQDALFSAHGAGSDTASRSAVSDVGAPTVRGELQLRVEQIRATKRALDRADAELAALRQTKLFRWTQRLRDVYGWLRRRSTRIRAN